MSGFSEDFKIKMEKLLREDTPKFFLSLEEPIQKAITVNFSRMSKEKFERVVDFNISQVPEVDNGYYVDNNLGIGKHILSHLGVIYSQEPSAMYPVEMLDVKPGDIVLDLCSAPGGKSIQILEKLNDNGLLVANEIVYNRAKILYENLNRMGFKNFAITCNSPQDYEDSSLLFDKILVDAPCGGEGMFRRKNFDFKAYNNASIETNTKRQLNILNSIKNRLKPNGNLVYSTCTYDIRENEEVIAKFLNENPDFEVIECAKLNNVTAEGIKIEPHNTNLCRRRYPHLFAGEGQFMALLHKKGKSNESPAFKFSANGYSGVYKKDLEILRQDFAKHVNIQNLNLIKHNDSIFVLPDITPDFNNLNLLSIGTLMGNISKGAFKPAHNFFHTFGTLFQNQIELSSTQVQKYLQGLEIDIQNEPTGICVVTHMNTPLGGGKIVNGKLKNYYPKELRN